MNTYIQFTDKFVSYDTFMEDLSARIVRKIQEAEADPEFISQRKAYAMFGRANVERWTRDGKITPAKRPGKKEYRTADLRLLQRIKQDYF